MRPHTVRLLLVACAGAVLVGALAASLVADDKPPGVDYTSELVFSEDAGDPIDVAVVPDEHGIACVIATGSSYGSSTSCFGIRGADAEGSYQVVMPLDSSRPPLVVGVMPSGSSQAQAQVEGESFPARANGRWFLAELDRGALGADNLAPVSVEFD